MTSPVPTQTVDQLTGPAADLRADCIADSAGGLTFDIADPGTPGATHLVLQRRESGDDLDEVRLPLTPAADGRLRAALPSTVPLAEGRWDVYTQFAGGEPLRLTPGVNDLRSLVDRVPSGSRGFVAVRIPYATKHGNLSVRGWHRAPHAEAGELHIDGAELAVTGRVYGTPLTEEAHAELRGRHGTRPVLRAEVTADRAAFTFRVGYRALAAAGEPDTWDLWLHPAGESGPRVRIARLLDDVADKKPIFTYPVARLETSHGTVEAGPYYTNDNDLSVRLGKAG
ncbi:hypothetical protein ACWCP6_33765 [Streptomyces sp. NPDC002004]